MTLAAVVALLVVHNLATNLWAPAWPYVPANLATAGVLVAVAGTERVAVGGALVGVAAGLVVLVAVALLAAGGLLADRRMAGVDAKGTAWRALVRIPLGTVVLEEVAFRAVLPALASSSVASGLFGLWHVLPTARALEINGLARSPLVIGGAVGATTVVGLVLCALAAAGGGLLAPGLAHVAANSGATVAAYVLLRRRGP